MESRIVELEMKVTYQERTVAALNEALTDQQKIIDRLVARLDRVETQLRNESPDGGDAGPEPPPPHY